MEASKAAILLLVIVVGRLSVCKKCFRGSSCAAS